MRNPIRGETDAFYLALGGAGLTGASVAVGALVDPLAGATLFAGGVFGALIWELASTDPDPRRPFRDAAEQGRRRPRAGHGVLVVANRTLQGADLEATLRRRGEGGAELRVVAPILVSRIHYIASDVDSELREAHDRLAAVLEWAEAEGLNATGKVGDPNAALGAIEDELRGFAADEVVISTYPPGKSNWLETGVVERLREELDVPVTHVVVDPERDSLTVD